MKAEAKYFGKPSPKPKKSPSEQLAWELFFVFAIGQLTTPKDEQAVKDHIEKLVQEVNKRIDEFLAERDRYTN